MSIELQIQELNIIRNGSKVIDNFAAVFATGVCHGLIGSNGAGKSSLLQAILNLLPYEGKINLAQQSLHKFPPSQLARIFAYVPQQVLVPISISVIEYVELGRFPYLGRWGAYSKEDRQKAEAALEYVGIWHLRHRKIDQISGGELQKVRLAQAWAQDTPYILLDEPLNGLDPLQKEKFTDLFLTFAQAGKTLLCATHDWELMSRKEVHLWGIVKGKCVLQTKGGVAKSELYARVFTE